MIRKWIIVVNYDVAQHCVRLLNDLSAIPDVGLIFVDNCSGVSDYEVLADECRARGALLVGSDSAATGAAIADRLAAGAKLVLLPNTTNLGYSGGNNAAMRLLDPLLGPKGEYLVMNPDVFITPQTAAALLDSEAELCGPAVYEHWRNAIALDGLAKDFSTGFGLGPPRDKSFVSVLHGSCFKLSGKALHKYGFLPEDNFLYEEELRYFERVHRLGGKPEYLDHLQVEHIGKASTKKVSYLYFYYMFRNRLSYFIEVAGPQYKRYGKFCLLYCCWAQDVVRTQARRRNWAGIRGLMRGIWDGLRGIKGPFPEARPHDR